MTVPFTARLAVELAVEDVERTAAALRPRGAPFTEREYDLLIESRVREAMKELPADAALYFAALAMRDELLDDIEGGIS